MKKNLLFLGIVVTLLMPMISMGVGGQPIIEAMDYSPKNPTPQSTVHFQATVNGEDVTVYVWVEECKDDLCYANVQNLTMAPTGQNRYERDVTLIHEEANLVHYQIIVERDGAWYTSEMKEFNLKLEEDGEDNGGTPGFEMMILVIAFVALLAITKKRR